MPALLRWATSTLSPDGGLDAEVLLANLLGCDRAKLLAMDGEIEAEALRAYQERIVRRQGGEPVAYITGKKEFYSLEFQVDPRVLIPRPDTEILAEAGIRFLREERGGVGTVADIGTGAGPIAVSVASEVPACSVIATDISAEAIDVARSNADLHGVGGRIRFLIGDLDDPLRQTVEEGGIDAILCNPPYVRPGDDRVDLTVREFEPGLAVFVSGDPLRIYERLARAAIDLLSPGGLIACEVGLGMEREVLRIVSSAPGLRDARILRDISGLDRVVTARRAAADG
ncbi:MAG: peptide chain release factor N(5)-glutamine methyltransferase [Planctomycetota bacterium]|nr:peptide chain release factor N(5)-glutamine methyltransferase [Planctomycetota bacterium]